MRADNGLLDGGGGGGGSSDDGHHDDRATRRAARDSAVGHLTLDLDTLHPTVADGGAVGPGRKGQSEPESSSSSGAAAATAVGEAVVATSTTTEAATSEKGSGKQVDGGNTFSGRVLPVTSPMTSFGKELTGSAGGGGGGGGGEAAAERARLALRLWWPLLAGLAGGAGDPRLDCRAAALSTLQDVLKVRANLARR